MTNEPTKGTATYSAQCGCGQWQHEHDQTRHDRWVALEIGRLKDTLGAVKFWLLTLVLTVVILTMFK